MNEIDADTVTSINKLLRINNGNSKDYSYGQLRRAAAFVVKLYGHQWAMKVSVINEKREDRIMRGIIRKIIENAVLSQGKSIGGIWRRFRFHAIKIGTQKVAKETILKASSKL